MSLSMDYIGGLFDGDGHVSISKRVRLAKVWQVNGVSYSIRLGISQSDRGLLEAVGSVLDGRVYKASDAGPNSWGIIRNRTNYALLWSDARAVEVARALEPYCHARKEELQVLLSFHEENFNSTKGWGRSNAPPPAYFEAVSKLTQAGDAAISHLKHIRLNKNTEVNRVSA